MSNTYTKLMEEVRDLGRLGAVAQMLEWDQETYMPKKGVRARSELLALTAGIAHERLVCDKMRGLIEGASAAAGDYVAETNIRETRRVFERAANVPTELVKELARMSSVAKDAWVAARKKSDFGEFEPLLLKLVELKKQLAEHIGYQAEPYDALLDEFEPGATAGQIEGLFAELRERIVTLLNKVKASAKQPDLTILNRSFPIAVQKLVSRKMAESLHYDFDAGRCDVSVHPFCCTVGGPDDVRITTRYMEQSLTPSLFGTLHEVGHALYEQGLPSEHTFTPSGEAISLGIHESQSRLWENFVGRSKAFWAYHWSHIKDAFPEALGEVSVNEFYEAINAATPSMIRVEADELTYNLHIILRFEIERGLFDGSLSAKDLPTIWNERMQQALGITPKDDVEGCLQDIHWSMGGFGYFPTYALGNLYAAQFFEQAGKDIPDLWDRIQRNDNQPLLDWLRDNIHRHGQRYRAGELVEQVTGKPLSIDPLMDYLTKKLAPIYGL